MAKPSTGVIVWINILLVVLAVILLVWALQSVPLKDVWRTLQHLTLAQIGVLISLNAMIAFLLGVRWWIILRAQGYTIPYPVIAGYRIAAFSISYFTPGPHLGGEPLQVILLARKYGVSIPDAAASVALDKLLDMLGNSTFLLIGLWITLQTVGNLSFSPVQLVTGVLILMLIPIGFLAAYWGGYHPIASGANLIVKRLPPHPAVVSTLRTIESAEDVAADFCRRHPLALVQAAGFSLVIWLLLLLEYAIAVYFLTGTAMPVQVINLMTATRIAILLPSPGGLGTIEASQVLMSQALGLSPAVGLGLSALIRFRDVTFGLVGLWWGGYAAGGWQTLWTQQEH